ncbi:hypothetical protein ACGF3K_18425, partial [Streptomyces sp. NPDC047980]|uniref:DUF7660 family protein n=1 Tax=Streptomyces sp. NPDC047980 TaxID=3365494 RepID=UPI00372156F6
GPGHFQATSPSLIRASAVTQRARITESEPEPLEINEAIRELRQDYLRRGHEWENQSLDHFLEALAAWMDDSPGWYRNFGKQLPEEGDWTFLARALPAATVYE